jgi:hypothetical protein
MTIGPESFGNGAAKTEDRFTGYRPRSSRDGNSVLSGSALSPDVGDDLTPRNGASSLDRVTTPLDIGHPIASTLTAPKLSESTLETFGESTGFSADGWLELATESVVDHPLLRGLLLELPPKGATLQSEWLDRWFEAARSIFELLYSLGPAKRP